METINKMIKNKIDNLKDGDYICELDYTIISIENGIFEVSNKRYDCIVLDYGELFDKLYEDYMEVQANT